jgi:hypothetical protein
MNQIKDRLIGRQIPLAFLTEEKPDDDDTENITVPGLKDGVYYAQRLYDDRNKYIDYVEMEVQNGMITKIKWDAFFLRCLIFVITIYMLALNIKGLWHTKKK